MEEVVDAAGRGGHANRQIVVTADELALLLTMTRRDPSLSSSQVTMTRTSRSARAMWHGVRPRSQATTA